MKNLLHLTDKSDIAGLFSRKKINQKIKISFENTFAESDNDEDEDDDLDEDEL